MGSNTSAITIEMLVNICTCRVRRGTVQDLAPETGGLRKPTPKPAPVAAAPPEPAGAELAALPGAG